MPRYNEYMGEEAGVSKSTSREYAVADGVTVTSGDLVYLDGGRVTNASIAGKRLLGQVQGGDTQDLDRDYSLTAVGDSDGTVKVLVNTEIESRYLMESDEDTSTLAAADVGELFDLIGATGVQKVDSSSAGATGQVRLIERATGVRGGDATHGIFAIAESQKLA